MKASAYGCVGGDKEPVAILVIDSLARMMRVSGASSAPVAVVATVHDKIAISPRPLTMLHCSCRTKPGFGLVSSRSSDERNNQELKRKAKVVFLLFSTRL